MKLLLSHVNYPSQFRRLLFSWVNQGHDIVFLCRQFEVNCPEPVGFRLLTYQLHRETLASHLHPYLCRLNSAIIEGQSAYRSALALRNSGWYPDCIVSHVGFGNGLFLKDCFPLARRVGLLEWFYNAQNSDADFLSNSDISDDHRLNLRIWNSESLLELSTLDRAVVPTQWQFSQFPPLLRQGIDVFHEGVDYERLSSMRDSSPARPDYLPEDPDIQILTYVSRCFEEYRGFPQIVQSIALLLEKRQNLHVIMVGQDCTAYGHPRHDGDTWSVWAKRHFIDSHTRIHWVGSLPQEDYYNILAISDVHFYMTVPFILSWSLLEAMSAGCSLVCSSTAPVLEVLTHEHSALLVDFFDVSQQVHALDRILSDNSLSCKLSFNAKKDAAIYSYQNGFRLWDQILST